MRSKVSLVLFIILAVFVSALIGGYVLLKIFTSEEALKAKITEVLKGNIDCELNIGSIHFDLFGGLDADKIEFRGNGPGKLRINAERIIVRHDPLAMLRGKFVINSGTIISPDIFAKRDKEVVWKYLFGIKAILDKANIGTETDHFKGGLAVKSAKVHIFDEKVFKGGALNVEDADMFLQPFGGSLRDVHIKGRVNGGYWEGFEFDADANFTTPELKIVSRVRDKFMTEDLMKEVPGVGKKLWETYSPTGRFNLTSILNFNGGNNERKSDSDLVIDITDAQMTYVKWPLLVKHVNGILELTKDGIYLKSLKGNIQNEGQEPLGEIDAFFSRGSGKKNIKLKISDINITESLVNIIPDLGKKIWNDYAPQGKIDISLNYEGNEDKSKTAYSVEAMCKGVEAKFPNFPFRMSNIIGFLKMDGDNVHFKNMSGNLLNGTKSNHATFDGVVNLKSKESRFTVSIPDLDLTEELIKGIPGMGEEMWSKYRPKGQVDMIIDYTGRKNIIGKTVADYSIEAVCKGIEARYPNVPYPLSNIVGLIVMNSENIYFKNMSGNLLTGTRANRTTFDGAVDLKNNESYFTVSIPNLDLTEKLIRSIPEKGDEIWSEYKPTGQVDLTINYSGNGGSDKDEYLITADCMGSKIEYARLKLEMSDIIGRVIIDKDSIQFKNLRGYAISGKQYSRTTCNGVYGLKDNDTKLVFSVFDLKVTQDLLDRFPELFQKGWVRVENGGWMDITVEYRGKGTAPKGGYSIVADSKGCKIGLSTVPLSISDIEARVNIEDGVLTSRNFSGTCSDGKINGFMKIGNMSLDGEYTGELKFSEVDLRELVRKVYKTNQDLSGVCEAKVDFRGKGVDLKDFTAKGHAKLKDGYITDVPLLLSILKLLNLSLPKKEAFHSADITYTIKEKVVNIEELEVLSDTIELGCLGTIGFDGALDLSVVVGFNQETFSQIPLIGELMDYVVGGVRKKLTKVQITGTFSDPQGTMIALKPFTQPLRSIFGLLTKGGSENGENGKAMDNTDLELLE